MIFHLGSAVRIGELYAQPAGGLQSPGWGRFMEGIVAVARLVTPRPVRTFLIERLGAFIEQVVDKPQFTLQAQKIQEFMKDPEMHVEFLRKDRQ